MERYFKQGKKIVADHLGIDEGKVTDKLVSSMILELLV